MIKFVIPIKPTAQMRTAVGAIKLGNGKVRGNAHKKKEQVSNEETIKAFLAQHKPARQINCSVMLGVKVFLPVQKNAPDWFNGSTKEFHAAALKHIVRPITTPDMDNFLKQIQDCITQMAIWRDDSLVVGYLSGTGKYYTDGTPRWEIEIQELSPDSYCIPGTKAKASRKKSASTPGQGALLC